jgi:hypothetical protein
MRLVLLYAERPNCLLLDIGVPFYLLIVKINGLH